MSENTQLESVVNTASSRTSEILEILDLATVLIGRAAEELGSVHREGMRAGDAMRSAATRHLDAFPLPPAPVMTRRRCRSSLSSESVACAYARFITWQRLQAA